MNQDKEIIEHLGRAWNAYVKAYGYQPAPRDTDDLTDFRKIIHDGQRLVACKAAERELPEVFGKSIK